MRSKNTNYAIWMISVAFAALVIGQFLIPPGTVDTTSKSSGPVRHNQTRRPVPKPTPAPAVSPSPGASSSQTSGSGSAQPDGQSQAAAPIDRAKTDSPPAKDRETASGTAADRPASVGLPASYSQLIKLVKENPGAIAKVKFLNGRNSVEVTLSSSAAKSSMVTIPGGAAETLLALLVQAGVQVEAQEAPPASSGNGGWYSFLSTFGPAILIVIAMLYMSGAFRRGGAGGYSLFGRSKAKSVEEIRANMERVSFDDVAGCDEAVRELKRIVSGLVDGDVYRHFKADRPTGILLEGPPGTGKTRLAKAVATECDGTMDIVSGSDFVEMFVGVGAARVRDMVASGMAKHRKTGKPHIIFIDEIDAIGGKRGSGTSMNRNDEREQTLNAILVAMDGAESSEGIIWMAATNRADMLDEALLRPGRFDCQVRVDLPDREGRAKIFAIHSRGMPLAAEVTHDKLAARTYGLSGAQIKLACSRAAVLAAERWASLNKDKLLEHRRASSQGAGAGGPRVQHYGMAMAGFSTTFVTPPTAQEKRSARDSFKLAICEQDPQAVITLGDFDEAVDFVLYGDARNSRQAAMRQDEKRNTAYHEAGHAVVAAVMPGADPVAKITIMSRSRALGYVLQIPSDDRFSMSDKQLAARMVMAMAGRAAQEIYLSICDTGAQNDFQQATDIAYRMVTEWGMSRLGRIAVGGRTSMAARGAYPGAAPAFGPELSNEIDREWRRIVEACAEQACSIVRAEKARMEATVKILLERETILRDQWEELLAAVPSQVAPEQLRFNACERENLQEVSDGR